MEFNLILECSSRCQICSVWEYYMYVCICILYWLAFDVCIPSLSKREDMLRRSLTVIWRNTNALKRKLWRSLMRMWQIHEKTLTRHAWAKSISDGGHEHNQKSISCHGSTIPVWRWMHFFQWEDKGRYHSPAHRPNSDLNLFLISTENFICSSHQALLTTIVCYYYLI